MSFLDWIFTISSCCLSTGCVSRYQGNYKLGCINILFNHYYINVLPTEGNLLTYTFGLSGNVISSKSLVYVLYEHTNLSKVKVKANIMYCFSIIIIFCVLRYYSLSCLGSFVKVLFTTTNYKNQENI